MARPDLPDDPSAEQVEAWIELAELVADPDFRGRVRAMSQRSAADRAASGAAAAPPPSRRPAGERAPRRPRSRRRARRRAVAAGVDPRVAPRREPVVDELVAAFAAAHGTTDDAAFRAWLADMIETFTDAPRRALLAAAGDHQRLADSRRRCRRGSGCARRSAEARTAAAGLRPAILSLTSVLHRLTRRDAAEVPAAAHQSDPPAHCAVTVTPRCEPRLPSVATGAGGGGAGGAPVSERSGMSAVEIGQCRLRPPGSAGDPAPACQDARRARHRPRAAHGAAGVARAQARRRHLLPPSRMRSRPRSRRSPRRRAWTPRRRTARPATWPPHRRPTRSSAGARAADALAALDDLASRGARDVASRAAVEDVAPASADEDVVARATEEHVRSLATAQRVVARAAADAVAAPPPSRRSLPLRPISTSGPGRR